MQLLDYLLGKSQFAPDWFYKLPLFMIPVYDGDKHWRWFGIRFDTHNALAGETLFMRWRNIAKQKLWRKR